MPMFYRVLDTMTRNRWLQKQYNSSHGLCPNEWCDRWNHDKSQNPDDYPLNCAWGRHTPAARACFIQNAIARNGLGGDPWPKAVLIRVGELDGPCVWREPEEAWGYAILGDSSTTWVVVFEGEEIGPIPETHGGGVQVTVLDDGTIYTLEEFAKAYGLELPKNEIDLGGSFGEYLE